MPWRRKTIGKYIISALLWGREETYWNPKPLLLHPLFFPWASLLAYRCEYLLKPVMLSGQWFYFLLLLCVFREVVIVGLAESTKPFLIMLHLSSMFFCCPLPLGCSSYCHTKLLPVPKISFSLLSLHIHTYSCYHLLFPLLTLIYLANCCLSLNLS